jgi:hypothetical protein
LLGYPPSAPSFARSHAPIASIALDLSP